MNYCVFKTGSSALLCVGSVEECAYQLGTTADQFQRWVNAPPHASQAGFSIHAIESKDPIRCPCEDCKDSPHTPGLASSSCDKAHCDKWYKWAKRYWGALRRKYVKKA